MIAFPATLVAALIGTTAVVLTAWAVRPWGDRNGDSAAWAKEDGVNSAREGGLLARIERELVARLPAEYWNGLVADERLVIAGPGQGEEIWQILRVRRVPRACGCGSWLARTPVRVR